jgi:hypothetical protein
MSQNNSTKQQYADQTTKGGVLGIITYLFMKWNFDPAFIALALPLIAAGLSWASTQIGDSEVASFFGIDGKNDGKPVKVAGKTVAKKAPAKKK